jgi:ParB family chromosome partitioning protein
VSVLRMLDPHQLVPNDVNPRTDLDIDDLVASIRNVGLLQALLVVPDQPTGPGADLAGPDTDPGDRHAGGQPAAEVFRIIAGHRRHAAVLEVGLEQVPCLVAADDGQASELIKILNENDLRTDLSQAQRVGLYQQLALLDWSAEDIAAAVVAPVDRVRGALAVQRLSGASRQAALQAADDGTLDLADAAALAEFDDPKVVERIISRGRGWGFTHAVAEERAKIERKDAAERVRAELVLAGARITPRPKDFGYGSREAEVSTLLDADGQRVDPQQALTRAGFAVFVDAQASPPRPVVYCTDPEEWGYTRTRHTTYVPEAVAEQRAREQAEREAYLQALTVAASVREGFLTTTYGTARGAKRAQAEALRAAVTDPAQITVPDTKAALVTRLAGCDPATAAATAGADRLARILVARWVSAAEANLDKLVHGYTWQADPTWGLGYLDQLVQAGYTLSDAEQRLHTDLTTRLTDTDTDPDDEDEPDGEDGPDGEDAEPDAPGGGPGDTDPAGDTDPIEDAEPDGPGAADPAADADTDVDDLPF